MSNVTLSIDDEVLKRARIRALEQGTSVNAVVRDHLQAYAGRNAEREQAVGRLRELSDQARVSSGNRTWTREELYDREVFRRHERR